MKHTYTAKETISINAPAARVWTALTEPAEVKKYLFGTDMTAEWRVGGSIVYSGEWEGRHYEDKGTVIELEPGKLLKTTYYSQMSGLEDRPENYNTISYRLDGTNGRTKLTIVQENIPSRKSAKHSAENWRAVLGKLKDVVEH